MLGCWSFHISIISSNSGVSLYGRFRPWQNGWSVPYASKCLHIFTTDAFDTPVLLLISDVLHPLTLIIASRTENGSAFPG